MWELLSGGLLRFVQERGDLTLFLVLLLEETGVPLPLPGDLALVWAGYRVTMDQTNQLVVLLVVEVATLIGAAHLWPRRPTAQAAWLAALPAAAQRSTR